MDDGTRTCALAPDQRPGHGPRLVAALLLLIAAGHVLLNRWVWSGIPLQTDTGIWAYIGGRILQGAVPFLHLWESKPQGIYYIFSGLQMYFGSGGDVQFLWLDGAISLGVLALTYYLARRFARPSAAALAVLLLSIVFCHRTLADWGDNVEKLVALLDLAVLLMVCVGGLKGGWSEWFTAGVYCGLAALCKQTGIAMFLMLCLIQLSLAGIAPAHRRALLRRLAAAALGASLVALLQVLWLSVVGALGAFWQQVVTYDLARLFSPLGEERRLLDPRHWAGVAVELKPAAILLLPALAGAIQWAPALRSHARAAASAPTEGGNLMIPLCLLLTGLIVGLFIIAPFGYGHYLLQAAPAAAILAAWQMEQALRGPRRAQSIFLTAMLMLPGCFWLEDHFRFLLNRHDPHRIAYQVKKRKMDQLLEVIRQRSTANDSVMLWPPDYAASYYAQRITPLEISNADVLFKGKAYRLQPPMPDLLRYLAANPPALIIDTTDARVVPPEKDRPGEGPLILLRSGVSLAEDPDPNHPMLEGRLLAPLKNWLRANYGGQERVGDCTLYYPGRPWRSLGEVFGATLPVPKNLRTKKETAKKARHNFVHNRLAQRHVASTPWR